MGKRKARDCTKTIEKQMASQNQEIIVENGSTMDHILRGRKNVIRHVLRTMGKEPFFNSILGEGGGVIEI